MSRNKRTPVQPATAWRMETHDWKILDDKVSELEATACEWGAEAGMKKGRGDKEDPTLSLENFKDHAGGKLSAEVAACKDRRALPVDLQTQIDNITAREESIREAPAKVALADAPKHGRPGTAGGIPRAMSIGLGVLLLMSIAAVALAASRGVGEARSNWAVTVSAVVGAGALMVVAAAVWRLVAMRRSMDPDAKRGQALDALGRERSALAEQLAVEEKQEKHLDKWLEDQAKQLGALYNYWFDRGFEAAKRNLEGEGNV